MAAPAERMKAMRNRRGERGVRELRLNVPDARLQSVKDRIAAQSALLSVESEAEAMAWIEAVSEFDNPETPEADASR